MIPNILAHRYASPEMAAIFSPESRIISERHFWVAVLSAQADLGIEVKSGAIEAYNKVIDQVDLASIANREKVTKHDVKARIDEFNALAGFEEIHKGLTSRDLTENVEQMLILQALQLVNERSVALLTRFAALASQYRDQSIVGRTHNVAAQPTTVGKRFAQAGEELLIASNQIRHLLDSYKIRGIKGPVGSQQDQLDLLGSAEKVADLETRVAKHLGLKTDGSQTLGSVGQVYPRSLDFSVVSALVQLGSGPANLAVTIRLMAGHDLATEGFLKGQVGSSAMPHKMNTRSCERANGLYTILRGYLTMASGLAGDQWNEGDVSCSVVRRVVMPDTFFALDGLFETMFSVLGSFGTFPAVIERELEKYLPFLATTKLLMHAVRSGAGREQAHEIIKTHAVATALAMRENLETVSAEGSLLERLGNDDQFPGETTELKALVNEPADLLGNVGSQIDAFVTQIDELSQKYPQVSSYGGSDIL